MARDSTVALGFILLALISISALTHAQQSQTNYKQRHEILFGDK
jgi:hypothetical protein